MQSADDEWDDGEWEEDYDDNSNFLSGMSVASKMKFAGGTAFVILILLIFKFLLYLKFFYISN